MFIKMAILVFIGLCAGGIIAAGIFAFLAIIGVFPRIIGKSGMKKHILLYETLIILGGSLGNALDLFEFPIWMGGVWTLAVFGGAVGIFVGCLAMSLAETLITLPVMNRRIHLAVGIQYVILAIGVGKLAGALVYFSRGMGN